MNFDIYEFNYEDRIGNLKNEAQSKVKSEKHFPIFDIDGEKYIFKPLSKTKPFLTPFFAYSEVFWSNIINSYFDDKAPLYKLAICRGLSDDIPKYYEKGTIVKMIVSSDEKLVNLFEFFRDNLDKNVDIMNYENYCGVYYDYTQIFNSEFFLENKSLGEKLAYQLLISILKSDNNYHYENVSFIKSGDDISLAPPIDHEFSNFFFAVDYGNLHAKYLLHFIMAINGIFGDNGMRQKNIMKNIDLICERYPHVLYDFLDRLRRIKLFDLYDNGYIEDFDSFSYEIGIEEYKNGDLAKANYLRKIIKPKAVDTSQIFNNIKEDISFSVKILDNCLSKKI